MSQTGRTATFAFVFTSAAKIRGRCFRTSIGERQRNFLSTQSWCWYGPNTVAQIEKFFALEGLPEDQRKLALVKLYQLEEVTLPLFTNPMKQLRIGVRLARGSPETRFVNAYCLGNLVALMEICGRLHVFSTDQVTHPIYGGPDARANPNALRPRAPPVQLLN